MKNTVFILISSFTILYSQSDNADIIVNDSIVMANVSLQFIKGDTMIFADGRSVSYTHIDSVAAIVERRETQRIGSGALIGGVVGVTTGLIIAATKKSDSPNGPYGYGSQESNTSNMIQYGLTGLGAGVILGGIVGSSFVSETERTYWFNGWSKADKLAFIRKLFARTKLQQSQEQNTAAATPLRDLSRVDPEESTTGAERPSLLIIAGEAFPVGDFGKVDRGTTSGLARPALTAGAFLVLPSSPRLHYQIGVLYSSHSIGTKTFLSLAPDVSAGNWNLITPLAGLQYGLSGAGKTTLYVSWHLGLLFGSTPEVTLRSGSHTAVQRESSGNALAIRAGFGFVIQKAEIGISYLYANPEYEISVTGDGLTLITKAKQPTSLVLMTIGYSL